jgi:hypothetical protein
VAQQKKIKRPDEKLDVPEGPKKKHQRKQRRKKEKKGKGKEGSVVASRRKKPRLVVRKRKKLDAQPDASRELRKKQSARPLRLRKLNVLSDVGLDGLSELNVKPRLRMLNRSRIVGGLKWTLSLTKGRNVAAGGRSDVPDTHPKRLKPVVESRLLLTNCVIQTMIISLPMALFIARNPSARRTAGLTVERTPGCKITAMLLHLQRTHRLLREARQMTLSPTRRRGEI